MDCSVWKTPEGVLHGQVPQPSVVLGISAETPFNPMSDQDGAVLCRDPAVP